jgi:hypothetical protein
MTTRRKGASRGVDLRWTGKEQDIKRAFTWLARTGIGVRSGSRPIGWVQQHNMAALDAIEAAAKREGGDLSRVSVRGGEVYAGSKRLGSVRSFYEAADRR